MKKKHPFFSEKSILITGGTGSFGQAFAKKLIEETDCKKVIIFSRDEWKQSQMRQSCKAFQDERMRYFLGDVRDANRLKRAFSEVDYIVHAAALKQVPTAEYNPSEFIKTNVMGAMNVIDAAIDCGVQKVISLSTDKAVNPINLYGATKLCSDKLFVAAFSYVGEKKAPLFSVVRYGNVLASRGSLVPYWLQLIEEKTKSLPVTDKKMTRFWISIEEAVLFVFSAFENMLGGEIFVPKIPSMKVVDLAKALAPKIPLEIVGIRSGEKIHEQMIVKEDAPRTFDLGHAFMIVPEFYLANEASKKKYLSKRKGSFVPLDFSYTSDTNSLWLTPEDLKKRLSPYL